MQRIRTFKPDLLKHELLFDMETELKAPVRMIFAGLWTVCDREGRFKWKPRSIRAEVFPFDTFDISRVLDALASRGFLVKYECNGELFGWVKSWTSHQFINNKEPQSSLPNPIDNEQLDVSVTRESRVDNAKSTRGVKEGKVMEGNGRHVDDVELPSFLSQDLWDTWNEHRKGLPKSRASWTPRAQKIFLDLAKKCYSDGMDVVAMMNSSIVGGYVTIYPDNGPKRKITFSTDWQIADPNKDLFTVGGAA